MAISSAICNTFKGELLEGKHDFAASGGHTFKLALYTSSASLGATTTGYSTSNEITNTSGSAYTAFLKIASLNWKATENISMNMGMIGTKTR